MKAEEYIQDHTRRCSNELVSVESIDGKEVRSYYPWMTVEGALEAVRIAREELSHSEVTKTCPRYDQEAVSEDLEKEAIDYGNRTAWTDDDPFNWILETAFKDGANWQKEQIAARDKTLDYYTFENGEKRFAQYILERRRNRNVNKNIMRKIVKAVVLTLLLISLVVCSIIMSPLLVLSVFTESE